MRFLPPDEHVELYETCFENDLLGREKISKALSGVLDRIEDPLVIALDGRWGTGKTYFLKRWVGAHRQQNNCKALTLYFDAFAHDYMSDPLIALVAALSDRVPKADKPKLNQVKRAAFKFIKPAARLGLALATYGATEALSGIGDAAAEAVSGEAEKAMDDFWRHEQGRQAAMDEFRAGIRRLTASDGQQEVTPLIIVIDELDRCRPDYALEVLEVIKHFFSVENVHFVLGVNLNALENIVRVRYGSEIDATSYLQKFLSFTIELPDHVGDINRTLSIVHYAEHLGKLMGIPQHLIKKIEFHLEILSRNNYISIRDVGKIMSAVALLPEEAHNDRVYPGWQSVLITLVVTRVICPSIFPLLISTKIKNEKLMNYIGVNDEIIQKKISEKENIKYNKDASLLYNIWYFIINDGKTRENDGEFSIVRMFSDYGQTHDVRNIPRKIYEDWLSVFRLA